MLDGSSSPVGPSSLPHLALWLLGAIFSPKVPIPSQYTELIWRIPASRFNLQVRRNHLSRKLWKDVAKYRTPFRLLRQALDPLNSASSYYFRYASLRRQLPPPDRKSTRLNS